MDLLNVRRDHYYDHMMSLKLMVNIKFNNRHFDNFGLDLKDN